MKQIISKRTIIAYVAVFLVAIAGFIAGSIVDFDIAESINAVYPSNNPTCIQAPVISVIAVGSILPTAFFGGVGGAIVVTSKQNKVFWTWFWRILAAAGTATILYSTYDSIAEAAEIYSVTANHQTLWKVIILIITLFTISGGFLLGLFKFKDIDSKRRFFIGFEMLGVVGLYFLFGEIVKFGVSRPRPKAVFSGAESFRDWWEIRPLYALGLETPGNCKSFVSGHVANTATYMIQVPLFLSLTSLGNKKWTNTIAIAVGGLYAMAVGVTRLYAGAHFLSDISGGIILTTITITLFLTIMPRVEAHYNEKLDN